MLDADMRLPYMQDMTLGQYLSDNSITEEVFAARIGLSQAQVNRLRHGKVRPSFETLIRIRDATGGAVTADDFLPPVTEAAE